jgi:hypothetical protein
VILLRYINIEVGDVKGLLRRNVRLRAEITVAGRDRNRAATLRQLAGVMRWRWYALEQSAKLATECCQLRHFDSLSRCDDRSIDEPRGRSRQVDYAFGRFEASGMQCQRPN